MKIAQDFEVNTERKEKTMKELEKLKKAFEELTDSSKAE